MEWVRYAQSLYEVCIQLILSLHTVYIKSAYSLLSLHKAYIKSAYSLLNLPTADLACMQPLSLVLSGKGTSITLISYSAI